jgi:glutaredoxin
MKFADDIIATCDQCKAEKDQIFKEIDSEFLHDYPPKREPFLSSEDVEEKEYDYQVDSVELEKEIDYEKQAEDVKEEEVVNINEVAM